MGGGIPWAICCPSAGWGHPGWSAGEPPFQLTLRLRWEVKGGKFEVLCSGQSSWGEGRLAPRTTGTQDCPALPMPKPPTAGAPLALTVTQHKRSAESRPSAAAEVDTRQATQGEAGHPGSPPLIRPSTVLRLLLSGPTAVHFGFWKHHQMARPPQGQSTRTCRPADVRLGPWSSHHSAPQGTERRRSEHIHV